jgi:O-glycosyl hydrolase
MPTHSRPIASSHLFACLLIAALLPVTLCAENKLNDWGRLEHIQLGKGWMPLQTDVKIALKNWNKILSLSDAKPAVESSVNGRTWRATLSDGAEPAAEVEQTVRDVDGKLVYDIRVTGRGNPDTDGVYFWVDVPAELFAGGTYKAGGVLKQDLPQSGELPPKLLDEFRICNTTTDKLVLTNAAGKAEVVLEFAPRAHLLLQDGRKWSQQFSILVDVCTGKLAQGQTAKMHVILHAKGDVDDTPAKLTLDPAAARYRLTGIGGDYCFNIESPVTRYTLDNLKVAFARTEMTLINWEPQNDNDDAGKPDWRKLVAGDVPGSRLRNEFELMRELSQKKIPFIASIWQLPPWLYTKPPTAENMNNRVPAEQWPELLECIATYLQYAKEKYGAEPDFFSFNEPNIGCRVAFNAQEHCDAIKRIGAHLAQAGLKTKMLLGDVASPRDTHKYVVPASLDPDAMKYVGALSFHSWGGASPEQYNAWADLAAKLRLPLIVAEAGSDAGAWQGGKYQSFQYGMQDVAHYQELLLHARPQAILLWEFTGDYSLLAANKLDKNKLRLTERFCFQKHWCDLTPAGSEALASSSDQESVMFTAFRLGNDFTLHIANTKWARKATLQGLPPALKTLNVVRTARGEFFKKLEPVTVADGKLALDLSGQSLTTFTTLPIPDVKEP